jgi:type IV pilus assembly protein PilC
MLNKCADYYDEEVELATQSLSAAMEPIIIVVMAGVVGVVVMAVMQPMFTMYSAMDNM